jgi:hypothetical protein
MHAPTRRLAGVLPGRGDDVRRSPLVKTARRLLLRGGVMPLGLGADPRWSVLPALVSATETGDRRGPRFALRFTWHDPLSRPARVGLPAVPDGLGALA